MAWTRHPWKTAGVPEGVLEARLPTRSFLIPQLLAPMQWLLTEPRAQASVLRQSFLRKRGSVCTRAPWRRTLPHGPVHLTLPAWRAALGETARVLRLLQAG